MCVCVCVCVCRGGLRGSVVGVFFIKHSPVSLAYSRMFHMTNTGLIKAFTSIQLVLPKDIYLALDCSTILPFELDEAIHYTLFVICIQYVVSSGNEPNKNQC